MIRYYVVASRSYGAYILPLLGPFRTARAASRMQPVVRTAVQRVRPDLNDCDIIVHPINRRRAPRGVLDLTEAVDDEWIAWCMRGGKR